MHIAIHCGGMPFNGETIPKGESLGGSESAAYYMALELAKLGHTVILFTNSQKTGSWDGVRYEWLGQISEQFPMGYHFHFAMQAPNDVVIAQRHPLAFASQYNSKLNIWWLHDLALYRSAGIVQQHLVNIDRVLTVSEFHRSQVSEIYGIDKEFVTATINGVDYDTFKNLEHFEREPRSLVFASRPERGLENLVEAGGIMEQLSDCHLYVCSYKNVPDQMRGFYEYLWRRCEELPNVTNVGFLGKRQLYELMAKSMLYVYPTTFEDTSNIVSIESNAAGTPFVGFKNAALPETIGRDGAMLLPFKDGEVDQKAFVKTVRKILNVPGQWEKLHSKAKQKRQSWTQAAAQWEVLFADLLKKRSSNKVRLYKHLERLSDIKAILQHEYPIAQAEERGYPFDAINDILPDFSRNYYFYLDMDFERHYDRYYQYEKDRGVEYGPEDLTDNNRFECISEMVKKAAPKTVLDYGCAHGHYVMNLLKRFPDIEFVGFDINESNILAAIKWAEKEEKQHRFRPEFHVGTHKGIPDEYKFDMIIAAEILEHVPDPVEMVESLMKHLNPDGTMLISTPYGPWEAIGYADHPGWRAHIHHFERRDLYEIFGTQENYNLLALPHRGELGHFVLTFNPSGEPIGRIDYQRKLNQQAPRETLSVCMIAKDEADSIGRTLRKVKDIADEIIVAIDQTTTDNTREIAESFGARCIEIPSPLEIGFDAARNLSIEQATMDWILWVDADETLENAQNLKKYLRPNCFTGYGVSQLHFAAEPADLIKTDFPVRCFRNHRGICFFGLVHEHPSRPEGPNEGVGKVMLLPDVAVMHTGYATEAIRRKRFDRNFPLIKRDREAYPDRKLGKFLYLRDLAHNIRYTFEANGRRLTPEIGAQAETIVELWRGLLEMDEMRMVVEGLPYYSEAVNLLGGGIEFVVNLAASANGADVHLPETPIFGKFAGRQDIEDFMNKLIAEQTRHYGEKYF